jgi:uncharacterized protein YjcR
MKESDILNSLHNDMIEKRDRILYEAARKKAEAVIFVDDIEHESIKDLEVKFSQKYKICEDIEEVRGATAVFDQFRYFEIPAYIQRIAQYTDNYDEFIKRLKRQHPNFSEGNNE